MCVWGLRDGFQNGFYHHTTFTTIEFDILQLHVINISQFFFEKKSCECHVMSCTNCQTPSRWCCGFLLLFCGVDFLSPSLEWRCFTIFLWCGAPFQLPTFVRCCFSCSFFFWVVLRLPPPLGWCYFLLLHYFWWCGGSLPSSFRVVLISSFLTTAQFSLQCYVDTLCTWHDRFRNSWLTGNTIKSESMKCELDLIWSNEQKLNAENWIKLNWIESSYTNKS